MKGLNMDKDKFKNLRYRLMETEQWPLKYMFKFITPNNNGKVDQIKAILPAHGETSFKHTSNLKHVAITCIAIMDNADQIIEVTEQVNEIDGVIIL